MDNLLPAGKLPGDLLSTLISRYRTRPDPNVLIDPAYGYDAAAVRLDSDTVVVKSDPITFATSDAARYLVAVNANDVSCIGAVPRWLTVVALLPEDALTADDVERMFADLRDACDAEGISLIGGHTEITPGIDRPLLVGTLLATPGPHGILQPGKANAGDALYLTQSMGIEGTALLAHELEDELRSSLSAEIVDDAKQLLFDPGISVSSAAQALLATGAVNALHDPTEGGVATAVHEIAAASGLSAIINLDAIPVHASTRSICEVLEIDPLGLLASGALLVAAPTSAESDLRITLQALNVPIARIGILTPSGEDMKMKGKHGDMQLPRFDVDQLTTTIKRNKMKEQS